MNKEGNKESMWQSLTYRIRLFMLIAWDIVVLHGAAIIALAIRFDFHVSKIDPVFLDVIMHYGVVHTVLSIVVFAAFHLYTSLWTYAGIIELWNIIMASFLSAGIQCVGVYMMGYYLPRSYFILYPCTLIVFTVIGRFGYGFLRAFRSNATKRRKKKNAVRTMVIGAGAAGKMLLKELTTSKFLNCEVPCIIDDDPAKKGTYLLGIPVVGNQDDISHAVEKYDIEEIIIAIPSLSGKEKKELFDRCANTGCKLKTVPGLYQLVNNEVSIAQIREVDVEDLLGREPVRTDIASVLDYVEDQVVLVTGGGGSIGSEIGRQVAMHHPKQLIILDNYENNAYELQMELKRTMPEVDVVALIASVQSRQRIQQIFRKYRPDVVFHAAAHKHVPLMEDSPCEAIKNNVIGSYNVAAEANRFHAKTMIMISTDKAVRPTNIMGASKRLCELMIQSFDHLSDTKFASVRFGNVLGSNGSVIPLFKQQIKAGGPVTVTHKDIIRYFMTIPEAVSLVLQAGAYTKGGEVFILDMGEPVKILDLAENLIRLSGFKPYVDIDIHFTGLRPGEKLYEELMLDDNNKEETGNSRIFIGHPSAITDEHKFWRDLQEVKEAAFDGRDDVIRQMVQGIVTEYTFESNK